MTKKPEVYSMDYYIYSEVQDYLNLVDRYDSESTEGYDTLWGHLCEIFDVHNGGMVTEDVYVRLFDYVDLNHKFHPKLKKELLRLGKFVGDKGLMFIWQGEEDAV